MQPLFTLNIETYEKVNVMYKFSFPVSEAQLLDDIQSREWI